jgi:hypothetical protein
LDAIRAKRVARGKRWFGLKDPIDDAVAGIAECRLMGVSCSCSSALFLS